MQILSFWDAVTAILAFIAVGYFTFKGGKVVHSYFFPDNKQDSTRQNTKTQKTMKELLKPFDKIEGKPEMTLQELSTCGKQYLGCKGRIFDVSSNDMYGPNGGYNLFIGKDSSVALAKMKFDKEFLDPS